MYRATPVISIWIATAGEWPRVVKLSSRMGAYGGSVYAELRRPVVRQDAILG